MKTKILLIADTVENKLRTTSKELVSFAARLSGDGDAELTMAVPGKNIQAVANEVAEKYGIDTIAIESDHLFYPNPSISWRFWGVRSVLP